MLVFFGAGGCRVFIYRSVFLTGSCGRFMCSGFSFKFLGFQFQKFQCVYVFVKGRVFLGVLGGFRKGRVFILYFFYLLVFDCVQYLRWNVWQLFRKGQLVCFVYFYIFGRSVYLGNVRKFIVLFTDVIDFVGRFGVLQFLGLL